MEQNEKTNQSAIVIWVTALEGASFETYRKDPSVGAEIRLPLAPAQLADELAREAEREGVEPKSLRLLRNSAAIGKSILPFLHFKLERGTKMIESAKSTSALKLFAIVGGLAVVLVGTSGCIRIVSHDTGEVTKTVTDSAQSTKESEGKMEYSITGVEVHDSLLGNGDKVAVIRWHAINNDSDDAFASPYFKVYQNKQVLSSGVADDYDGSSNIQELAPGGEFDGTATYEINDMSPVVIKLEDLAGSSNEFELTFNLE